MKVKLFWAASAVTTFAFLLPTPLSRQSQDIGFGAYLQFQRVAIPRLPAFRATPLEVNSNPRWQ
jgi:hypothetical protein